MTAQRARALTDSLSTYDIHHMGERDTTETETCMDCEGTGVLTIPAYSSGGEIIDEEQHPCGCTLEITD